MFVDAYFYESGTSCDQAWESWDEYCDFLYWDSWDYDRGKDEAGCEKAEEVIEDILEEMRPPKHCISYDAYNWESGTSCDEIWEAWDEVCERDWNYICDESEIEMVEFMRPSGKCLTVKAYFSDSDDEECNEVWEEW